MRRGAPTQSRCVKLHQPYGMDSEAQRLDRLEPGLFRFCELGASDALQIPRTSLVPPPIYSEFARAMPWHVARLTRLQ